MFPLAIIQTFLETFYAKVKERGFTDYKRQTTLFR